MMIKTILIATLVATAYAGNIRLPRLDGRIVGGDDVDITSYPYQLSLQSYGRHICGASIISANVAVTAAHCTDGSSASSLSIRAGVSHLQNDDGQTIDIAEIRQHPDFSMSDIDYDVSVLILADSIDLNESAQPVDLASANSDPSDGTNVVCTGWGATREGGYVSDQLQAVNVAIVGRDTCNDQYGSGITERMICAGVNGGGKDACQGDSGGPLVADGKLVGIVSWGYGCARPDYAGVYSNVGALRSFIDANSH